MIFWIHVPLLVLKWSYMRINGTIAACHLRLKIAAAVAKGGIADPDCPTDPMSTRYWVYLGMEEETQDKSTSIVSVEGAVHGHKALAALGAAQLSSGEAAVPALLTPWPLFVPSWSLQSRQALDER